MFQNTFYRLERLTFLIYRKVNFLLFTTYTTKASTKFILVLKQVLCNKFDIIKKTSHNYVPLKVICKIFFLIKCLSYEAASSCKTDLLKKSNLTKRFSSFEQSFTTPRRNFADIPHFLFLIFSYYCL